MARYSQVLKEAILKKLLPPQSMTVAEVALSEGVSSKTGFVANRNYSGLN